MCAFSYLSFFLAPVRLHHCLKECACSIAIWQLRARVDLFQRYNDYLFVCSGKTLAGTLIKGGIHFTKLSSLIRLNCGHLNPPASLLLHGSVDCTIVHPSVVTYWLTLHFLAFYLVATQSPFFGSTSFLSYFFVHEYIEVTWHYCYMHSCMQFALFSFSSLHMSVCVCLHVEIISYMFD